ncbi:MAG: UDPGP type 1 family protein [Bacteroidales bacterium]|nr:UDPGP type 1 family protein [Bacteroidales bacterium]
MMQAPEDLLHRLRRYRQEHILIGWDRLQPRERDHLVQQLAGIDFAELEQLFARRNEPHTLLPTREQITPLPVEAASQISAETVARGDAALRAGEVAVLLVAGGQGSRLGFDRPKGVFPVGPISTASLFRVHAEKVRALSLRYGRAIPFLVMTSAATHADTEAYFADHHFFGLAPGQVTFFQQGTMPALDRETGRVLLEKPGSVFVSPNGHGGTLTALADCGLLTELKSRGVRHIFYLQVDNPLVQIAEPAYIGRHIETYAEVSSKVVFKECPDEKVGVLAMIAGRCGIIEYSDMPPEMAAERDGTGTLVFRAGNPAIHLFTVEFLERITAGADRLAYHVARKKVPYFDPATDQTVLPTLENALKFELFVFDALPLADRTLAISVDREEEFAPVKNAVGVDSPETCRQLQINRAARWLQAAGADVPMTTEGHSVYPLEISPLFAYDVAELRAKLPPGFRVTGPTLLE